MATKDVISSFVDGSITGDDDNSNSSTLPKFVGDLSIGNLMPDGREASVAQARGATTGIRKGARAYPTISFSGQLADFNDAFHALAMGITAGFTSTTADIGDYPTIDLTFSADYSTDTRSVVADDCRLTSWDLSQGDPASTVSFSFEVIGPLVIDGVTYVSAR